MHCTALPGHCQVCDEGHRLKAKGGNKTIDALLALQCPRRVVLTGTPVQNNLDEFYGNGADGVGVLLLLLANQCLPV